MGDFPSPFVATVFVTPNYQFDFVINGGVAGVTITPQFTGCVTSIKVDGVTYISPPGVPYSITVTPGNHTAHLIIDNPQNLIQVHCDGDAITFNVSHLSSFVNLILVNLTSTNCIGNVTSLSMLTKLIYLYLTSSDVTGNISALTPLTKLIYLYLYNTTCSGNISSLSGILTLRGLSLSYSSCTGDFLSLSNLVALISLYAANRTFDNSTATAFNNLVLMTTCYLKSNALTEVEVDNALASLVICDSNGLPSRNCVVDLSGTNSKPSAAGLANKAILVASGWTVTTTA